jgi:hypothetical protein
MREKEQGVRWSRCVSVTARKCLDVLVEDMLHQSNDTVSDDVTESANDLKFGFADTCFEWLGSRCAAQEELLRLCCRSGLGSK